MEESLPIAGEEEQEERAPSLRETIQAHYDAVASEPQEQQDYEEAESSEEESAPIETQQSSRARDDRGRFAKGASKPKQVSDQTAGEGVEAAEESPIEAPNSWSAEDREVWATAPQKVKEVFLRRQREADSAFYRKSDEIAKATKKYGVVDEVFEQVVDPSRKLTRRQQLALNGVDEGAYIRQVVNAADFMDSSPEEALRYFINYYGIDPQRFVEEPLPQVTDPLHPLAQRIQSLEQLLTQKQQQEVHQAQSSLLSEIQSFASATDQNGKPLRPLYRFVEPHMVEAVKAVKQQNPTMPHSEVLQRAYDQVTSELKQFLPQQQATITNIEEHKRKIAEAKARGSSIVGSPGIGSTPQKPKGIRATLEYYAGLNGHG